MSNLKPRQLPPNYINGICTKCDGCLSAVEKIYDECSKTISGNHLWSLSIETGTYEKRNCSYDCTSSYSKTYPKCGACGVVNDKFKKKVSKEHV